MGLAGVGQSGGEKMQTSGIEQKENNFLQRKERKISREPTVKGRKLGLKSTM